ncbi:MAG: 30S ribosomal protein S18 [Verrucomicrobia bacterium]|nr:30S ribosomal protein S18 [Verrucomicrobiota bacterium]
MPRKNRNEKEEAGGRRGARAENRTPRPKPKIDFTVDLLDFRNVNLLRQYVTDTGRILPRRYTGLPAHYQRRLTKAIKRARHMLLMK